ncbi:hypothetical protein L596_030265 [Steinernema carpocapsae]|uniref:Uncharacterized protein n=1 Tax=Steinernema carpocapsae TaxID=34508 RepID=A0A4U5LNW0_STECR|nr:hypothetical protein L596_030265 [Steinernema carpocapsae]
METSQKCDFHCVLKLEMDVHVKNLHSRFEGEDFYHCTANVICPFNCQFNGRQHHLHCNYCFKAYLTFDAGEKHHCPLKSDPNAAQSRNPMRTAVL